ncbi:MAG: CHRD domain-containing protein [Crocinitomicaceae bacterium]|jgi:Cu/Zn superoxide dismutase|nr:CHRD domain-containing protein [Crocinitomicaceae bacterium]
MKKLLQGKWVLTLITFIGFTSVASAAHLGSQLMFSARMNGAQEVPAVTTDAAGVASMVLNGEMDSLCISVYMGGFGSNLGGVHLHEGAAGTNGNVVVDLSPFIVNGNIQVVLTGSSLPADLVQKIIEGNIYINAHTANNPNGEIRGQVKLEQDFGYRAIMNGAQEVPAVATNATGLGLFNLSLNKKKMYIWIVANGLSGAITGAHIHQGAIETNGGVAVNLTGNINGNTIIDTIDVSTVPGLIADLEAGNTYINFHTAANPNGEIRGQLTYDNAAIMFDAFLNGAQEVPAVSTTATGTASFSLNSTMTAITFMVQVDGLSGAITGAHLHEGTAGNNGPVVVDLSTSVVGNVMAGTITGTDLTQELLESMLSSGIYLNIHTAANPNGEIRGQINRLAREGYTFEMNGQSEVPAVMTGASGGGMMSISRERDNAHLMVVAKEMSADISGAHFHEGMPGANGNVFLDLTSYFSGNANISGAFTYLTTEDTAPFGPAQELLFRNGNAYLNIHNMNNMNGEIRGDSYRGSKCFSHTVGLNDLEKETTFGVYPNPATSSFSISMENFTTGSTFTLTDLSGKTIRTFELEANGQTVEIADLTPGVYFVNNGGTTVKIIKE